MYGYLKDSGKKNGIREEQICIERVWIRIEE
jgi:hypothetical protein